MLEINTAYANGKMLNEIPEYLNCGGYMGLNGDMPPVKTTKEAAQKPDLNAENPPKASAAAVKYIEFFNSEKFIFLSMQISTFSNI